MDMNNSLLTFQWILLFIHRSVHSFIYSLTCTYIHRFPTSFFLFSIIFTLPICEVFKYLIRVSILILIYLQLALRFPTALNLISYVVIPRSYRLSPSSWSDSPKADSNFFFSSKSRINFFLQHIMLSLTHPPLWSHHRLFSCMKHSYCCVFFPLQSA